MAIERIVHHHAQAGLDQQPNLLLQRFWVMLAVAAAAVTLCATKASAGNDDPCAPGYKGTGTCRNPSAPPDSGMGSDSSAAPAELPPLPAPTTTVAPTAPPVADPAGAAVAGAKKDIDATKGGGSDTAVPLKADGPCKKKAVQSFRDCTGGDPKKSQMCKDMIADDKTADDPEYTACMSAKSENDLKAKREAGDALDKKLPKDAKDYILSDDSTDSTATLDSCQAYVYALNHCPGTTVGGPKEAQCQPQSNGDPKIDINLPPSKSDAGLACHKALASLGRDKSKESAAATKRADRVGADDDCAATIRAAAAVGEEGCKPDPQTGDVLPECKKRHGCSVDKNWTSTLGVMGQVATQGVQLVSQATSQVALMNVQSAQQKGASGASGANSDDIHKTALRSMATAQDEAAAAQAVGAAALTTTAVLSTVVATRQQSSVDELKHKRGQLIKHNALVEEYKKDPSQANWDSLIAFDKTGLDAGVLKNSDGSDATEDNDAKPSSAVLNGITTETVDAKGKKHHSYKEDPNNKDIAAGDANAHLQTFDEAAITAALKVKQDLSDLAMKQAVEHYTKAGVLTVGAIANEAEANALRDQANGIGTHDVATAGTNDFHAIVAGGPNGQLVDTSAPPSGVTQTLGDGAAATAAEAAQDTSKAPAGAIPPPLFGGGANPGGLKDAGPGVSGGTSGIGSSSGGGGSAGGGSGGGAGGGDGSGGGADKAGDDAVGSKTKFEGAATGGGGFASNSSGTRDKNTGMSVDGILSGLMGGKEDRKLASDIVNFGKDGAAAKAQAKSDEEEGILGKNTNLFTRVSKTTVSYYKTGKLK